MEEMDETAVALEVSGEEAADDIEGPKDDRRRRVTRECESAPAKEKDGGVMNPDAIIGYLPTAVNAILPPGRVDQRGTWGVVPNVRHHGRFLEKQNGPKFVL